MHQHCFCWGGIVSCLISSSIGVSSLVYAGFIPIEQYLTNWLTWWLGDVIGVIIFAPLTLIFFADPRDHWKSILYSVAVPVFVALVLVVAVFSYARQQEKEQETVQFKGYASSLYNQLQTQIHQYHETLYALTSFFEHSEIVTRSEFKKFTNRTLAQQNEIQALAWIPYPPAHARDRFEQRIKDGVDVDFKIFDQQNPFKVAPQHDEYSVTTYIEPYEKNKPILNLNILSDKKVTETLLKAIKTKETALTSGIELIADKQNRLAVIMFRPVYKHSSGFIKSKLTLPIGFVAGVFYVENIIHSSLPGLENTTIAFNLYDQSASNHPQLIYSNQAESRINIDSGQLTFQKKLVIADRQWQVLVSAIHGYPHKNWSTWFVLSGGFIFTAMFSGFLMALSGRSSFIKQAVEEKTKDLEKINFILNRTNEALASTNKKLQDSEYQFRKLVQTQSAIVWRYDLTAKCFTFVVNFRPTQLQ